MKKFRFEGWAVFISVIVVVLGLWLLLLQFRNRAEAARLEPYTLVPSDAWMVIDLRQAREIKSFFLDDSLFWEELNALDGAAWLKKELQRIDSVFTSDSRIARSMEASRVLVSLHQTVDGQSGALVQFRPGPATHRRKLEVALINRLKEQHGYSNYQFMGVAIHHIAATQTRKPYWFAFFQGSVLLGQSQRLIELAITQFESGSSLGSNQSLSKVRYGAAHHTNNFYLDGSQLCKVLNLFTDKEESALFPCRAFSGWMAWDFTILDNELRLTGLAQAGDQQPDFLGILSEMPAAEPFLLNFVPSATAALSILHINQTRPLIEALAASQNKNNESGNDTAEAANELQAHLGRALAEAMLYNAGQSADQSVVVLVHVNNATELAKKMNALLPDAAAGRNPNAVDTVFNKVIWHLPDQNWLGWLTGGLINYKLPYFAILDSVLVAAANPQNVNRVLLHHNYGQVIALEPGLNDDFIFQQPVSNLLYLVNLPYLAAMIHENLGQPAQQLAEQTDLPSYLPDRFAAQFVAHQPGLMFSNISIHRHGAKAEAFQKPLWQISLDTIASIAPTVVINHNDRSREIIIQDKNHYLYLIDGNGKILWKKPFEQGINSKIYQVDRYNNGRLQYLFSTLNHLYLVDRNGNTVRGYPIRLPSAAAHGITLVDYDNNKNYRILFTGADRRVYNLQIDGVKATGWRLPTLENPAGRPIQHLKLGNIDYLAVSDEKGIPYFMNRLGQPAFRTGPEIRLSEKTPLFLLVNQNENLFVGLGPNGEIMEISKEGAVRSFKPDSLAETHGLLFIQDRVLQQNTVVMIGNRSLKAFDRFGKNLFGLEMPGQVVPPAIETRVSNMQFIGLRTENPDLLYVIDNQGRVVAPFPMRGNHLVMTGSLQGNQVWNVISVENERISAFLIGGF